MGKRQQPMHDSLASLDAKRALLFALLFAVAVPWYWNGLNELASRTVFGFPAWFLGSVIASAVISATAAWCFSIPWREEQEVSRDREDDEVSSPQ